MQLCGLIVVSVFILFAKIMRMDIHKDWLEDGIQWEHEQKMGLEEGKKKEKKSILKNRQEKKTLRKRKIMRKRRKFDLLETLKDLPE